MSRHIANIESTGQHDLEMSEKLLSDYRLTHGYDPSMERVHKMNAARLR